MQPNLMNLIEAMEGEELVFLQNFTQDLNQDQLQNLCTPPTATKPTKQPNKI